MVSLTPRVAGLIASSPTRSRSTRPSGKRQRLFSTTEDITIQQVADARMARLATSKRTNPQHKSSLLADGFSWGECASFFEIMADGTTGTVKKEFIEYWFRKFPLQPLCVQPLCVQLFVVV